MKITKKEIKQLAKAEIYSLIRKHFYTMERLELIKLLVPIYRQYDKDHELELYEVVNMALWAYDNHTDFKSIREAHEIANGMKNEGTITKSMAAKLVGVTREHLYKLIKSGEITLDERGFPIGDWKRKRCNSGRRSMPQKLTAEAPIVVSAPVEPQQASEARLAPQSPPMAKPSHSSDEFDTLLRRSEAQPNRNDPPKRERNQPRRVAFDQELSDYKAKRDKFLSEGNMKGVALCDKYIDEIGKRNIASGE